MPYTYADGFDAPFCPLTPRDASLRRFPWSPTTPHWVRRFLCPEGRCRVLWPLNRSSFARSGPFAGPLRLASLSGRFPSLSRAYGLPRDDPLLLFEHAALVHLGGGVRIVLLLTVAVCCARLAVSFTQLSGGARSPRFRDGKLRRGTPGFPREVAMAEQETWLRALPPEVEDLRVLLADGNLSKGRS